MKGNKGFTLIEVLVVVAIMGLLAAASVNVYYYLRQADVKQSSKVVNTMLEYTRTNTMSINASWEMRIEKDTNGMYYATVYRNDKQWRKKELGKRIKIYTVTNTSAEIEITSGTSPYITFKSDTGGVKEYGTASGSEKVANNSDELNGYRIKCGDKTVDVEIVPLTGAHYVEY